MSKQPPNEPSDRRSTPIGESTLRPVAPSKTEAEVTTDEALARLDEHRDEQPTLPEIHIDIRNEQRGGRGDSARPDPLAKVPAWVKYLLPALAMLVADVIERLLNG